MANKNYEILVIPDVHARDFWREPVKYTLENTDARIVFLGDFCDPYPTEFEKGFDYRKKAIEGLREIIEIKAKDDKLTFDNNSKEKQIELRWLHKVDKNIMKEIDATTMEAEKIYF